MGLSAPKSVRKVLPNCCANCVYFIQDPEPINQDWVDYVCKRNGEPVWGELMFVYDTVCDGFKHINSQIKAKQ